MANRVFMGDEGAGKYVLKISLPGFDVLSPDLPSIGTSFNSNYERLGVVWMQGKVTLGGNFQVTTIPYGKTFDKVPQVFVYELVENAPIGTYSQYGNGYYFPFKDRLELSTTTQGSKIRWYIIFNN